MIKRNQIPKINQINRSLNDDRDLEGKLEQNQQKIVKIRVNLAIADISCGSIIHIIQQKKS